MAALSAIFTIPSSGYSNDFAAGTWASLACVAAMLGEDEDWLSDVALELEPEDGRMTVYGVNAPASGWLRSMAPSGAGPGASCTSASMPTPARSSPPR
jgi:hypothetical protein